MRMMLFCDGNKRKYRDELFQAYLREYPANTEELKEKYVFLKAETEGIKVSFGVFPYLFALIVLVMTLFRNNMTIFEGDFIVNTIFVMIITLIILTLLAQIWIEKKIIEMNVIKEIFPYVNGVNNKK